MTRIILIGYMGAGKTTIGKVLAREMGMDFYDLDNYIEGRFHQKIPEVFAEKGEEGFREVERKMLHEVAEFENIILSCGGGTPCFFDNMDYMNLQGETAFIEQSLQMRLPFYQKARHTLKIETIHTKEQIKNYVDQIIDLI